MALADVTAKPLQTLVETVSGGCTCGLKGSEVEGEPLAGGRGADAPE